MYNQVIKCLILSFITTTSFSGRVIGEEIFQDMEYHIHVDDLENAHSLDRHMGKKLDETLDKQREIEDEDEENEGRGGAAEKAPLPLPHPFSDNQTQTLNNIVKKLQYVVDKASTGEDFSSADLDLVSGWLEYLDRSDPRDARVSRDLVEMWIALSQIKKARSEGRTRNEWTAKLNELLQKSKTLQQRNDLAREKAQGK